MLGLPTSCSSLHHCTAGKFRQSRCGAYHAYTRPHKEKLAIILDTLVNRTGITTELDTIGDLVLPARARGFVRGGGSKAPLFHHNFAGASAEIELHHGVTTR